MTQLQKYQKEFVSFRNELETFIYRIVNHRQEAQDVTQDTYIKVFRNINSFQEKSSFKTWTFAIATNLLRDSFRARQKWGEDWQDLGREFILENEQVLQRKINDCEITSLMG